MRGHQLPARCSPPLSPGLHLSHAYTTAPGLGRPFGLLFGGPWGSLLRAELRFWQRTCERRSLMGVSVFFSVTTLCESGALSLSQILESENAQWRSNSHQLPQDSELPACPFASLILSLTQPASCLFCKHTRFHPTLGPLNSLPSLPGMPSWFPQFIWTLLKRHLHRKTSPDHTPT